MTASASFEIIRIALQDLATDAAADPALVAHYQAAGVNAAPVMVQRHDDLAYSVISGHEVVAAMQAAGLTWCWCLVMDASYQQERALVAAAEAAPEAAPAPKPARKARKARKAAPKAKAPTVKELRAQAKAQGLRGYSRMTKAQLLALLALLA